MKGRSVCTTVIRWWNWWASSGCSLSLRWLWLSSPRRRTTISAAVRRLGTNGGSIWRSSMTCTPLLYTGITTDSWRVSGLLVCTSLPLCSLAAISLTSAANKKAATPYLSMRWRLYCYPGEGQSETRQQPYLWNAIRTRHTSAIIIARTRRSLAITHFLR